MSNRASEPEAWFRKAEHDLLSIANNMGAAETPWDTVCFNAQQAAEKYLKGFIVRSDPDLSALEEDCRTLSRLGWTSRYPDTPDVDEAEGRQAHELARRICEAIRQRVPPATP